MRDEDGAANGCSSVPRKSASRYRCRDTIGSSTVGQNRPATYQTLPQKSKKQGDAGTSDLYSVVLEGAVQQLQWSSRLIKLAEEQ